MGTFDLGALVCLLRATDTCRIDQFMGRATHQLGLSIIQRVDPALSQSLHNGGHGARPFATSIPMSTTEDSPLWGTVQPGERAWVRLVGLQQDVTQALSTFADDPPASLQINYQPWQLEQTTWESTVHTWAARANYAELITHHERQPVQRHLTLHFATPTSFHSKGMNVPLPLPTLVFGSLVRKWEEVTPFPLPDLLMPFIEHHIVLSKHHIESRTLTFKQRSKQIGFAGDVTFTLAKRNHRLEKDDPALAAQIKAGYDNLARMVNMLTAFGFYSGIGIKTSQGMGMVMPHHAAR